MITSSPEPNDAAREASELEQLQDAHARLVERAGLLELAVADREDRLRVLNAKLLYGGGASLLEAALRAAAPPDTRRRTAFRKLRRAAAIVAEEGPQGITRRVQRRAPGPLRSRVKWATQEDAQYLRWRAVHEPTDVQLGRMRADGARWGYRPRVSVVVPVYNPPEVWLDDMISSVLGQVYNNWELCLADDASPSGHVRRALERWAATDSRIKVGFCPVNGNISAASNAALALATGEYVALLDHDDELPGHALHAVVAVLQDQPDADVIFSDEDKILLNGEHGQVHFKGEYDPDYLLSTNYVSHLSVVRRSVVERVGGFRVGYEGSQDHDLVLRCVEDGAVVTHIPDVLYAWKQVPGSAALHIDAKPEAWEAGRQAVEDALVRRGVDARAEFGEHAGLYNVRYALPDRVGVTLVLRSDGEPPHGVAAPLTDPLPSGVDAEVIIAGRVTRRSRPRSDGVRMVAGNRGETDVALLNRACREARGDVVVVLDADLAPNAPGRDWLSPLLEQALRPEVGVAGGRILRRDGSPEQEGLHLNARGLPESLGVRWPVIQRTAFVGAGCLAIRRELLSEIGGFDERFRLSMHDIDLCMRVRQAGLGVLYSPLTELFRARGSPPLGPARDDVALFSATWGERGRNDPYVSPWLERVQPFQIKGV